MQTSPSLPAALPDDLTEDRLEPWGLTLLQRRGGFRFGVDAVVLASEVALAPGARALELGAGCGVVSLILARRFPEARSLTLVEQDEGAAALALENVLGNGEGTRATVLREDYTRLALEADVVYGNPPWRPSGTGREASDPWRRAASVETTATLAATVAAAARAVVPGGKVVLMYPSAREGELLDELALAALAPARILRVSGVAGWPADRVVVQAVRGPAGRVEEATLGILEADGCYTEAAARAYGFADAASMTRGGRREPYAGGAPAC